MHGKEPNNKAVWSSPTLIYADTSASRCDHIQFVQAQLGNFTLSLSCDEPGSGARSVDTQPARDSVGHSHLLLLVFYWDAS